MEYIIHIWYIIVNINLYSTVNMCIYIHTSLQDVYTCIWCIHNNIQLIYNTSISYTTYYTPYTLHTLCDECSEAAGSRDQSSSRLPHLVSGACVWGAAQGPGQGRHKRADTWHNSININKQYYKDIFIICTSALERVRHIHIKHVNIYVHIKLWHIIYYHTDVHKGHNSDPPGTGKLLAIPCSACWFCCSSDSMLSSSIASIPSTSRCLSWYLDTYDYSMI